MSMKLTPAAAVSTTTWPGPGSGSGWSACTRTSGPPVSVTTIARMTSRPSPRLCSGVQYAGRALAGRGAGDAVRVLAAGQHQREAGHDRLVAADVEVQVEEGDEQAGGGEHDAGHHRPGDPADPGHEHDREHADRGERGEAVGRQL